MKPFSVAWRRVLLGTSLTALGSLALGVAPAAAYTTVTFCSGGYPGHPSFPDNYCSRGATFQLNNIATSTTYGDAGICTYRGSTNKQPNPPMPYGEHCTTFGQTTNVQPYYNNSGNPAVHNRNSYYLLIGASYTRV